MSGMRSASSRHCGGAQAAPIMSTKQLTDIIARAVPGGRGRIHPATRTFQALRIEVGGEVDQILDGIAAAAKVLSIGGRLAVITFHGLEERLVKQAVREYSRHGDATETKEWILVRASGVTKPDQDELRANSRSRSAKLRVFEKVAVNDRRVCISSEGRACQRS